MIFLKKHDIHCVVNFITIVSINMHLMLKLSTIEYCAICKQLSETEINIHYNNYILYLYKYCIVLILRKHNIVAMTFYS